MARELSSRLELRLTPSDKRSCELKAKQAGLSLSQWIRRRLLLDVSKPPAAVTPPLHTADTEPCTSAAPPLPQPQP
jgi:HicB family